MRDATSRLVGRRAEFASLGSAVDRVRHGGGSFFLLGEAGSGKSRLVGECAYRAVDTGVRVLRGRGSPMGTNTPFRPLVEALSSHLRTNGPPRSPELDPYRPALAGLIPEWRVAGSAGPVPSLVETSEALLRLLAVLGRDHGTLLVLEDLHDADLETIAVVEYLVDNLTSLPVLVVATLRPEPGPALDLVNAVGQRRMATVVTLGPLDPAEVRQLAAGLLDTEPGDVPDVVVDRLVGDGAGNPYMIEELLAEMVDSGGLQHGPKGWQATGDLSGVVPRSVVDSFSHQLHRLGPGVQELLHVAAVLGHRFSLPVAQLVTGSDDRSLLNHLRTATEAHLIVPDGSAPDWYSFRHTVTAEAILAALLPGERAAIARHAATEIERADPDLPDERCQLVATLRLTAGDNATAARHYAEAGRRALAAGGSASAGALLEQAYRLAAERDRADIFELLVGALAEGGRLDHALALMATAPATLGIDRRIALHTALAWAAVVPGQVPDAEAQVAAARALLTAPATPEQAAALLVVEAHLAFLRGSADVERRRAEAEWLAQRATDEAERIPMPVVACQALQLQALLARERGFAEAGRYLERMLAIAETHALPTWRVEALIRLGVNDFMCTANPTGLERARQAAFDLGCVVLAHDAEDVLAMNATLCGDYAATRRIIDNRLRTSPRNGYSYQYLMLTSATRAAHRGRRAEMEAELAVFVASAGPKSLHTPLAHGLCRAICALLGEDRALAAREFDKVLAWEAKNPGIYYLAGQYGLHPLLRVVEGDGGWPEHEKVMASPAAQLRWNRQFLLLSEAVLLGRAGRGEEATAAVTAAREVAAPYPMARALGLRLVSEAALADGWGEPTGWLRAAEEFFHTADIAPVAGACRAMLRQAGARIIQRRDGSDQIPRILRDRGVTIREYEVFVLLDRRPGNKLIGQRLFISPRTVEKHIASLIVKIGCVDRAALCDYASELTTTGSSAAPA